MTEPALIRARLREASAAFLALRPAVLAGEPWPLAAAFDHSDEARWGPPEVLAHVAEMLPYWLREVERILVAAPARVPFGRAATDAERLAGIDRDRTLPLRELFERIDSDCARLELRLAGLTAADLERVGLHVVFGPIAVGELLERFVVAHLAGHVVQLGELVGAPPAPAPG